MKITMNEFVKNYTENFNSIFERQVEKQTEENCIAIEDESLEDYKKNAIDFSFLCGIYKDFEEDFENEEEFNEQILAYTSINSRQINESASDEAFYFVNNYLN